MPTIARPARSPPASPPSARPSRPTSRASGAHFRGAMRSDVRLLDTVTQYLLRQKGKEIRPTLVLLAAQMTGGVTEKSYRGAALVELLHTATLVHDDVVDEAETRRGLASVNALWKNKVGVLLGDYLLSRGLLLALDAGDVDLLTTVSTAVRRMSEGELYQIEKARTLDATEAAYFRIIADKTASLLAACMAIGAMSRRRERRPRSSARRPSARRSAWPSRSATTCSTTTPTRARASRSGWTCRSAR